MRRASIRFSRDFRITRAVVNVESPKEAPTQSLFWTAIHVLTFLFLDHDLGLFTGTEGDVSIPRSLVQSRTIGVDRNPPNLEQPLGYVATIPVVLAPSSQFW
jgi:hypothetical protein